MCSVDGCPDPTKWRELCNRHYLRLQRYGSPTGSPPPRVSPQHQFFEDALARQTDDCIVWPYAKSKGYGKFTIDGIRHYVHVHALERAVGPAPDGMVARHGPCHNPACFNPRHLSWGTRIQNQTDRRRDGTASIGSSHPAALLTEQDVLAIRASAERGVDLAQRYGVKPPTIYAVRRRQTWRHV